MVYLSSSFILRLDTAAPQITWGAATGTTAGELFRIAYTVDEPGVVSAGLELADGRVVTLTVHADRLEALLPADTPQGNATVRALVRDDVLNEATRTTVVSLTGGIVEPEPTPTPVPHVGGMPQDRRRVDRQAVYDRSTAVARSRSHVVATSRTRDTATTRTHTTIRRRRIPAPIPAPPEIVPVIWRDGSTAVVTSRSRINAGTVRGTRHSPAKATSRHRVRRADSPDVEALILDL